MDGRNLAHSRLDLLGFYVKSLANLSEPARLNASVAEHMRRYLNLPAIRVGLNVSVKAGKKCAGLDVKGTGEKQRSED
jgi:hypothetical protein